MKFKYAFMTFSTPKLSLAENFRLAKQLGYEGIEPRAEAKHGHGVELTASAQQRKDIARQAADAGVAICCIATSCGLADPTKSKKQVEDGLRYVDLAADVGCSRVRVFGGAFPDDISRNQAIDVLADSLRALGQHAATRNVAVCLETHDSWTLPNHLVKVMKRADHPAVKLNFDLWHPLRSSGVAIDKAFDQLKGWIAHAHIHDGGLRLDKLDQRAIGTGELDLRSLLKGLRDIDYQGYLSGEWIEWEPAEVHLPREIAAMRKLEQEI